MSQDEDERDYMDAKINLTMAMNKFKEAAEAIEIEAEDEVRDIIYEVFGDILE